MMNNKFYAYFVIYYLVLYHILPPKSRGHRKKIHLICYFANNINNI